MQSESEPCMFICHQVTLLSNDFIKYQDSNSASPVEYEPAEYANMEIIQEIIAQRKENSSLPSDNSDSG